VAAARTAFQGWWRPAAAHHRARPRVSLKFLHRIVVSDRFEDPGKIGPLQEGWAWYVGT
jgi:hypothetical protein